MAKNQTATTKKASSTGYAIAESSGTQVWLQANRYYDLDRLKANVDETVKLDKILLVNDGKKSTLGKPYVTGASVELKILEHRRGPKILVYKMRPKKKTRTKNGHRQELTRVMVTSISNGTKKKKASSTSKPKAEKSTSGEKSSKVEKATE